MERIPKLFPVIAACAVLTGSGLAAWAQGSPTEDITVTGTKSREVIQNFVTSFATPARLTDKLPRWESGVCPLIMGQPPAIAQLISQRVRDLAVLAGAPVNKAPSCTPNIHVIFTTTPQDLLDDVRTHQAVLLGYADSARQRDRLAVVRRPIQAWYTTQTQDFNGRYRIDISTTFDDTPTLSGGLSRIQDALRSSYVHAVIVADTTKLQDESIGPLADYIAVLALTQINSLDGCQPLPSIMNLLAKNCAAKTDMLTGIDVTFLQGLYHMRADHRLASQKAEIADVIQAAMAAGR
jgi:hypothetical protein